MLIFKFDRLVPAAFVRRLNKFLVEVRLENELVKAHLHDPGRLIDLLKENRKLLLMEKEGKRKTKYDIIFAYSKEWVLVHSGYHSKIAEILIKKKLIDELKEYKIERGEYKIGKSRVDFLLSNGKKCLLEVKGCTLVKKDVALFPDAPTERGRKHVLELIESLKKGYDAAILFLIMRKASQFSPNWEIDEKFSYALKEAYKKGVKIIACRIKAKKEALYYQGKIPVKI